MYKSPPRPRATAGGRAVAFAQRRDPLYGRSLATAAWSPTWCSGRRHGLVCRAMARRPRARAGGARGPVLCAAQASSLPAGWRQVRAGWLAGARQWAWSSSAPRSGGSVAPARVGIPEGLHDRPPLEQAVALAPSSTSYCSPTGSWSDVAAFDTGLDRLTAALNPTTTTDPASLCEALVNQALHRWPQRRHGHPLRLPHLIADPQLAGTRQQSKVLQAGFAQSSGSPLGKPDSGMTMAGARPELATIAVRDG